MARWNPKANEIFLKALEVEPTNGRQAFIDEAADGDPELRAQVNSLVEASDRAGSYLESPALGIALGAMEGQDTPSLCEGPGAVIGRYKLLQQIGEGGMGVVFLAEQTRPVRRTVAMKIVKAGMDTKQVIARFEAERQALAMMEHPNIARVLDAGATDGGRPFFVMELVKGVSITKYCDERRLTPRDRLLLFVQVCAAVQHAHQKGIIHRDLKPSNVLVAAYDGHPVPKVIDFGVAKATGSRLTERTLFTGFGAMVGTLEYMSPEQAELNQLDVDTRADIYSLGVLLYELLTGTTPLEGKRLKEAALVDALRAIRDEEPAKPSTRLSTTAALPAVAFCRGVEANKLNGLVRGDLDWIVMKCLEKDRGRRYETANGLARDIERYLNDEPVQACPPSTAYRIRKFARRHRPVLLMTALLGLVLLAAIGLTAGSVGWAARDRTARQAILEREAGKALEEGETWCRRDRIGEALAAVRHADALLGGGTGNGSLRQRARQWRADLEMAARLEAIRLMQSEVEVEYFNHAVADPEYAAAFGGYGIDMATADPVVAVARIRESVVHEQLIAALDDWAWVKPAKDAVGREQLYVVARLADPDDWRNRFRDPVMRKDRRALEDLADKADIESLSPPSVVLLARALGNVRANDKALKVLRRGLYRNPGDFWLNHEMGATYGRMVQSGDANPGTLQECIGFFRIALACRPDSPSARSNLAWWLSLQGNQEEAIALCEKAILLEPNHFPGPFVLGIALNRQGSYGDAVAALRRAVELQPKHYWARFNLAGAYRNKGDWSQAIEEYRRTIRLSPRVPEAHYELGMLFKDRRQWPEAAAKFREVLRLKPGHHGARSYLAIALAYQGSFEDALVEAREAVRLKPQESLGHWSLGFTLHRKGRLDDAVAAYRQSVQLNPRGPWVRYDLGRALLEKGEVDAAVAEYREATRLQPETALFHNDLGVALRMTGELDEAVSAFGRATALDPRDGHAHYRLGLSLRTKGDREAALAAFRAAIDAYAKTAERQPTSARALNNLAWALATCPEPALRDGPRAVRLAMRSVALAPSNGNYWNTLAAAHACAGDWESALRVLEQTSALRNGGDGLDWFLAAIANQGVGDTQKAREWYLRAVEWMDKHKPNDDELQGFRSEAAERLGIDAGGS